MGEVRGSIPRDSILFALFRLRTIYMVLLLFLINYRTSCTRTGWNKLLVVYCFFGRWQRLNASAFREPSRLFQKQATLRSLAQISIDRGMNQLSAAPQGRESKGKGREKSKKCGVTGNRTPDLSHAKGILYH